MSFDGVDINNIILSNYVKYSRLDELIRYAFANYRSDKINLYIDLYPINKTFLSRSFVTKTVNYLDYSAGVLNMCAHYKEYFRQMGVHCKIFIINSFGLPENSLKFVSTYNSIMQMKIQSASIYEVINSNLKMLNYICPYIPDIHFLHTKFESGTLIMDLIQRELLIDQNTPSLIISKDLYPLDLVNVFNDVAFLSPMKYNGDISQIVTPKSHPEFSVSFWNLLRSKRSKNYDALIGNISPVNFITLSALNGFPERSIKSIINLNKASRMIYNIVRDNDIKITPNILFKNYYDEMASIGTTTIDNRFKVLDNEYQRLLYTQSIDYDLIRYENLTDTASLQVINSKYFANNPIDIQKLL
jgi:hypothetical protein